MMRYAEEIAELSRRAFEVEEQRRAEETKRVLAAFDAVRAHRAQVKMWCVPCRATYMIPNREAPRICPTCGEAWK